MHVQWQPYREPVRVTLIRTFAIAAAIGAGIAGASRGGLHRWHIATLVALWPALGGHFVELFFLNWLRPRLHASRAVQVAARFAVWFVGGIVLAMAMKWTAMVVYGPARPRPFAWWVAGLGFIVIELVVHLVLQLSGRGSFYDGRG